MKVLLLVALVAVAVWPCAALWGLHAGDGEVGAL